MVRVTCWRRALPFYRRDRILQASLPGQVASYPGTTAEQHDGNPSAIFLPGGEWLHSCPNLCRIHHHAFPTTPRAHWTTTRESGQALADLGFSQYLNRSHDLRKSGPSILGGGVPAL